MRAYKALRLKHRQV